MKNINFTLFNIGTFWMLMFAADYITVAQAIITDRVLTVIDSLPQSVGGVTMDNMGYIYSADFDGKVYKINPHSKEASVYAEGFYLSTGNTFDSRGRLYQANLAGNYISRVSRTGAQEIFADSLFSSPIGIAFNSKEELFVCNCSNITITKVSTEGQTEIFAESALFHCPNGIAVDAADNIYVVSYNNNNVVKITPEGEAELFAQTPDKIGNGHVAIGNNRLYITGFHGHRIYEVTMDGKVSVLAGTGVRGSSDGSALNATFTYPNGIAYDGQGTLYINERHKDQHLPSIYPSKTSIRAIKLARISEYIKKEIDTNGIQNSLVAYKKLKSHPRFITENTENEINALGHEYLLVGKYEEARAVFKMNIETYPDHAGAYAFMGRSMFIGNQNKEALKYYKQAQKLLPDHKRIKAIIEDLEKAIQN